MSKLPVRFEGDACEFPFDTVQIIQSDSLPRRTLIAPVEFVQECRHELERIEIQILPGDTSAIHLSTDLFDAFLGFFRFS